MVELIAESRLVCKRRGAPPGGRGKIRNRNRNSCMPAPRADRYCHGIGQSLFDSLHDSGSKVNPVLLSANKLRAGAGAGSSPSIPDLRTIATQPMLSTTDDTSEARLLSSFVPALMLDAMSKDKAAIKPPATRDYMAAALFAVCVHILR